MFHSRTLNNKINSAHERALRIIYNDRESSFKELLRKDNPVSIHHRNLQVLEKEIFKIKNNMTPEILNEISRTGHHRIIYGKTQAFMLDKYIQYSTALNQRHL